MVRFEGKSRCGVYLEEYVVMSLICCQPTLFYHYHSRWALYIPILICFDADSYSGFVVITFFVFFRSNWNLTSFCLCAFCGFLVRIMLYILSCVCKQRPTNEGECMYRRMLIYSVPGFSSGSFSCLSSHPVLPGYYFQFMCLFSR